MTPVKNFLPLPSHLTIRDRYPLFCYILFFFSFSAVGWVWEVGLHLVQTGELVNRGVLLGPWLPIYGSGGVVVLLLLRRVFHRPGLCFVLSMVLCSVIEYGSSFVLELATGQRWWDYSTYFLNLNGRICLEGAIVFGIGCCAVIYVIAPLLANGFERLPKSGAAVLCTVLVLAFAADGVRSSASPNSGEGVTSAQRAPILRPWRADTQV